jgi:hypothetical protein
MHKALTKIKLIRFISFISLILSCHYTISKDSVFVSQQEFISLMHEQDNDTMYLDIATEEELVQLRSVNPKKAYTIVIYIAADNDLHPFAWKNIKQMENIGSSDNVNVIVQLNTPGYLNPTKRYVIKKGKRLLVPADGPAPTQKLNSGSPQTLIDCVAWAMKYYPADNLVINLWDHGSGVYDPISSRIINSSDLFKFNEETNELELDRTIGYTERMDELANKDDNEQEDYRQNSRGICFDETFKSYMNNQDLKFALSEIQNKVLGGKKISVLWFDACLMAMLEIANLAKDHVDYLVASEEVEYASGSNYELVLRPLLDTVLTPKDFACHIVNCYEKAYQFITRDYTQSAMELSGIAAVEANVHAVASQLLLALQDQKNNSVTRLLQQCKTRPFCICFEERSYIDLRNFYMNLQANLQHISLNNATNEGSIRFALVRLLDQGINLINTAVVNNKVGSNLQKAGGISIYFPERGIFASYPKCNFAKSNNWSAMIAQYLLRRK